MRAEAAIYPQRLRRVFRIVLHSDGTEFNLFVGNTPCSSEAGALR